MEEGNKEEVKKYLERSQNAIETTKLLIENGRFSDAVSKAYYSMFYAASGLLRTRRLDVSKHSGVISLFGLHFAKTGIINPVHHRRLIKAFEDRDTADYSILEEIKDQIAIDRLKDAEAFITDVEDYLKKEGWIN